MTAEQLRALCPTCRAVVPVRRQGAAWRMLAHPRTVREFFRDRDVACPVRGVDAAPAIVAWLDRRVADVGRDEATEERRRREAMAQAANAAAALARLAATRETLAALRALVPAEGARP